MKIALSLPSARLSLYVLQARPYVLEAFLALTTADEEKKGEPIMLSQTDGGPAQFSDQTLKRLAGHLLDRFPLGATR